MFLGEPSDDASRFLGLTAVSPRGGRYPLGELVGAGSQALVFAVPGAPLVVKVLRPSFVTGSPEVARVVVEKEHVALARMFGLGSPYLIRLFDSGTLPLGPLRLPWLALSRVPASPLGLTLGERVQATVRATGVGYAPSRAMRLLWRLSEGLRVLHEAGLIHRDLKPSNVLVAGDADDETPLIADFGIVRAAGLAPTFGGGFRLGSPGYGAPESADATRVSAATDLFSFAAITFLLLAGEPPFGGSDMVIWAHIQGGVLRPLAARERLHPALRASSELPAIAALLQRALSPRPAERPPSVRAFWTDFGPLLGRVMRDEGMGPPSTPQAPRSLRETAAFEGLTFPHDDGDDT